MDEQQVGKQFVLVYYRTLFKDPNTLLSLYKENSTLTRREKNEIVTYKGLKEISQALESTKPKGLLDVRNVVVQNSFESSLIVTVTGLVHHDPEAESQQQRPFTQVFVLHPQQPKGLFVLNEIFLNTDIDEASEEQDFLSAEENLAVDSKSTETPEEKVSVPVDSESAEKKAPVVEEKPVKADPEPEVPVSTPQVTKEPAKQVENEPKAPEPKENSATPKKKRKEKKPKSTEGKASNKSAATSEKEKEKEKEKEPKKQSWASIAKSTPPPQPAPPVAVPVATPAKKLPVEETKEVEKTPQSGSPADARYLEVCDFNSSAKLDTLKNAFRIFGAVSYVHFLGHTRALVEFQDPKTVTKILALKEPVSVNGKTVRIARGNSSMKQRKRNANQANGRGGNNNRGSTRGKNNTARQ